MADYDDEECVCAKCHEDYSLGENCVPSKYCNRCVHDVVEAAEAQLSRATAQLENVLDSHAEGTWQARALDAERENIALKAALKPSTVKELEAQLSRATAEIAGLKEALGFDRDCLAACQRNGKVLSERLAAYRAFLAEAEALRAAGYAERLTKNRCRNFDAAMAKLKESEKP